MFAGVFDAPGIHPFHIGKIEQSAQHRFYGFAPDFYHSFGIRFITFQFLVHGIIQWLVDAVIQLFVLGDLATALLP